MASTDPYLPLDIIKKILSEAPLCDFQRLYRYEQRRGKLKPCQHLCSYADRYWYRYEKKLMAEKLFDNEEDQYLFLAGWEHGEVTYNSHLHMPPVQCMQGAVRQQNAHLLGHFLQRFPNLPNLSIFTGAFGLLLEIAAQANSILLGLFLKEVGVAPEPLLAGSSCSQCFPVRHPDMFQQLLARRDFPGDLFCCTEAGTGQAARYYCIGLISPLVLRRRTEPLVQTEMYDPKREASILWVAPARRDAPELIYGWAISYLFHDSQESFVCSWEAICKIDDRPSNWLVLAAHLGAPEIVTWLLKSIDTWPLETIHKSIKFQYVAYCRCNESKQLQVIKLLLPHADVLGRLLAELCARFGDQRLFEFLPFLRRGEWEEAAKELLYGHHYDLLKELYDGWVAPHGYDTWDPLLWKFVLDHDLPALAGMWLSHHWTASEFTYSQWQKFAEAVREGDVEIYAHPENSLRKFLPQIPTPELRVPFLAYCREDWGLPKCKIPVPPYLIFGCPSPQILRREIERDNLEYVEHYYQHPPEDPVRKYTGKCSEAMRALLERNNVDVRAPKQSTTTGKEIPPP